MAKYFGGLALVIPLVIYMYYVLIESWCLGYAFIYLTDSARLAEDPSAFFGKFVGIEQNGIIYEEGSGHGTWVLLIVFVLNFVLIYRGVSKGIEQFCKVAMPLMLVLGVIVLVRVLTLGTPDPAKPDQNVLGGLGFMWNPKPAALLNPATWLAASGQIFFSLSVGFGIIINYASYLTKKDDVALSGLTSCSMNEFFEVCMGGLITLPAAFIFLGVGASAFTGSSFSLGFAGLAQRVRPDARRADVRRPVVLYAVPGGDHQQHFDAAAGDRVSGGRIRAETARLGDDPGRPVRVGLRLCAVLFQRAGGAGHV